jgi:hypothetical protein
MGLAQLPTLRGTVERPFHRDRLQTLIPTSSNFPKRCAGSSAASSRRPLAARFAQMAISHKSKNAPGGITSPYGIFRYRCLGKAASPHPVGVMRQMDGTEEAAQLCNRMKIGPPDLALAIQNNWQIGIFLSAAHEQQPHSGMEWIDIQRLNNYLFPRVEFWQLAQVRR